MNKILTSDIKDIIEAVRYRPSISIIMPFTAKINLNTELEQSFKIAVDKVARELKNNYPEDISELTILKLKLAIGKVDLSLSGAKKGVAIYVSPVFEKVLYLDTLVQERIVVDESFEIRDLVYSKKQCARYLLLILSAKQFSVYLCSLNEFTKIETNIPESIQSYVNEWPEKVANFTDGSDRRQIVVQKFLQHIDTDLGRIIQEYELPVFVMGVKKILGHFKKISKHQDAIAGYISGNYDRLSFSELDEIMKSHLEQSKHEKDKTVIDILDIAEGRNKLVKGIKPVWEAVMNNLGNKIFVESDYVYAAQRGATPDVIENIEKPYNEFSYIRDAVDDIIEKALLNGGDVDFVDSDSLKNYEHIALVTY